MENEKLFEDKADLYATARPLYPGELFEFIASLPDEHGRAWDCAAGNGQAALGLARHFKLVEATDISKEQITNAFKHEQINYSVQPSEKTDFPEDHFDLINVAQALHWFDFDKFWDEAARVLKPGGAFAAYAYAWTTVTAEIDAAVKEYILDVIKPYWAQNNKLCWDGYKTLALPFERRPVPQINLVNHWKIAEFLDYLHTWSAVRRCMDDIGPGFFETARAKLLPLWGGPAEKKIVTSPLAVIAGKAW